MANILLVDPDEMAHRAMRGILARANHRCVVVPTAEEAWDFIRRNLKIDLVILELKLPGDSGTMFIDRLKADLCLKHLPILVYAGHTKRETVKTVLAHGVQNLLFKPYHDEAIFSEIAKAGVHPWFKKTDEEEEAYCKLTGNTLESLRAKLEDLRTSLDATRISLTERIETLTVQPEDSDARPFILEELTKLSNKAEEAGVWEAVACIAVLIGKANPNSWSEFKYSLETLGFFSRLIFWRLNPELTPDEFLSYEELNAETEARSRELWGKAAEQNRYPVIPWPQLQREIDSLSACPVIESAAAAFHMSANGSPTSLHPLMDLVDKDPGLTAQVLITVNQLRRSKEKSKASSIEDPRIAIGMLGEIRLSAMGRSLLHAQESMMLIPEISSWPQFWMFQIATARIAQFTCIQLELFDMETLAYTAGLMHDLGKVLLLRLHPMAFQTIQKYARANNVTLAAAEIFHLGATTQEMAAHFADKRNIPTQFANVMRWVDSPEKASKDSTLVAIVALARHLCRQNLIGFSAHTPQDKLIALEHTAAWRVLEGTVFLSFNLKKFEAQVRAECRKLARELHGRLHEHHHHDHK